MSEPKVIYLGPACEVGAGDGRTWAEDNPWPDCECGHRPVQYVLGETFDRVVAERDALQLRLNTTDEALDKADDDFSLLSLEAGRRMDLLEGLLRRTLDYYTESCFPEDLLAEFQAVLKPAASERDHEIPGTSGMRLNMLANQGE